MNSLVRVGIPKVYPGYDFSKMETTPQVFILNLLGGYLITIDEHNQLNSAIAKSWEVTNESKTFKITLSNNAKFSDGTHITTEDVEETFLRYIKYEGTHLSLKKIIKGAEQLSASQQKIKIEGLEIIDPHNIKIHLNRSEPQFLYWLAFPELAILPKEYAKKNIFENHFNVTSGPYFIESRTNSSIKFKRNPHFYGSFGNASDSLEVLGINTTDEAIKNVSNGSIDLLDYGAVLDPEFEKLEKDSRLAITAGRDKALAMFVINPKSQIFKKNEDRTAFLFAISKLSLIPYGEGNIFFPAKQFLSKSHLGYLSGTEIDKIYGTFENKINLKIKIKILYPKIFGDNYRQFLERNLLKNNITPSFIEYEEGNVISALNKENYDVFFIITGMAEKDTGILMSYHFQRGNPLYRFHDKDIESALEAASKSSILEDRSIFYKKVNKILIEKGYIAPVAHFTWPLFHKANLYFEKNKSLRFLNDPWTLSWKN